MQPMLMSCHNDDKEAGLESGGVNSQESAVVDGEKSRKATANKQKRKPEGPSG